MCAPPSLTQVYAAVEQTLARTTTSRALLSGGGGRHGDWGVPGQGLAVLLLEPSAAVLDFQAALLAAVTPFAGSGGTPAAFVTDPGQGISQSTMDWVDGYVPSQIGEGRYVAHITVGFATLDDLKSIEAEPFDAFDVHPASVAVYHLGDSGAARQQLKSWPLTG